MPLNVPAVALLKFIWSCAPASEFTFVALSVVEPVLKPVPETVTVVDAVSPVPFTITVDVCVVLSATVPKSTVLPAAGDV